MQDEIKVQIVPRTVDTSRDDLDVAEATRALNKARERGAIVEIQRAQQEYAAAVKAAQTTTWVAQVGGVEFPIVMFGTEPDRDGRVLVSLVLDAAAVSIGTPEEPAVPASSETPKARLWGDPSVPDPRADLPGWSRPVSADIAEGAKVSFTDSKAGDRLVEGLRRAVRIRRGPDAPGMEVPA